MGKLATLPVKAVAPKATIKTRSKKVAAPDTATYGGGAGFTRKTKGELFLLAVSNMVGEDTFYEGSSERDARFRDLIAKVTQNDPDWIARFVPYLRNEMNMRSASIVMAVEYVVAGGPNGRRVIDSAIVRADEPAEVIGYYRSRYKKSLPQPIKRGVADGARRVYSERAALKYDGDNSGYRLGDVIELVHPEPKAPWQSRLFRYIIDKRHNRDELGDYALLPTIQHNHALMTIPVAERRAFLEKPEAAQILEEGAVTWEALSGWLQGPMDSKAWEAIIPSMGYMALIRNLRNFEDAKISDASKAHVIQKLADAEEVAKSRQLPLRFYSAFKNVNSFDYLAALEKALDLTLQNVPSLPGRTLILVDNSGSMGTGFSNRGTTTSREIAALFGAAVALRAENADLFAYESNSHKIDFHKSEPVLALAKKASAYDGGTETFKVLAQNYDNHDRVIILTDEQAFAWGQATGYQWGRSTGFQNPGADAKSKVESIKAPIYTFNLVGYKQGHLPSGSGNRYTFGGLTDTGFRLISLIEAGENEVWPF